MPPIQIKSRSALLWWATLQLYLQTPEKLPSTCIPDRVCVYCCCTSTLHRSALHHTGYPRGGEGIDRIHAWKGCVCGIRLDHLFYP